MAYKNMKQNRSHVKKVHRYGFFGMQRLRKKNNQVRAKLEETHQINYGFWHNVIKLIRFTWFRFWEDRAKKRAQKELSENEKLYNMFHT
jgi:hypothetical protein